MRNPRRGLLQRFTATLLVVAMPMCCCIVNAAAGVSCCTSVEAVAKPAASCCSSPQCQLDETSATTSESLPCGDSDCQCCLKAPSTSFDWTPPIDTIGTPLPLSLLAVDLTTTVTNQGPNRSRWKDPPPRPRDPDHLRGHVILQV